MALSSEECKWKKQLNQRKRGAYFVHSPEECFSIAKYAVGNGTSRAVHHFKRKYPSLNESTVHAFKAKYEREKKAARIEKRQPLQKYALNHEEDE